MYSTCFEYTLQKLARVLPFLIYRSKYRYSTTWTVNSRGADQTPWMSRLLCAFVVNDWKDKTHFHLMMPYYVSTERNKNYYYHYSHGPKRHVVVLVTTYKLIRISSMKDTKNESSGQLLYYLPHTR